MADLEKIVEEISQLSLLEASELVNMLEEKLGVSAAAPVAMAAMPVTAAAAEPEEEKTEFDVVLKEIGPKKIEVIKAKEMVDAAPSTVMEAVAKEAAEDARGKLEGAGAVVEVN